MHDQGVHTFKDVSVFCRSYREDPTDAMRRLGLDRKALLKEIAAVGTQGA
jgi:hypothetical protein